MRDAVCVARSSVILYSALFGSSWTALVKCVTAASQSPAREASSPLRKALVAAEHPDTTSESTIRATSLCLNTALHVDPASSRASGCSFLPADAFLTRHADRLLASMIEVLHRHALDADLQQPVLAGHDVPFASPPRLLAIAERRKLLPRLRLEDADELQRDRRRPRRWRRRRRRRWDVIRTPRPRSRGRRRGQRRRVELERVPPGLVGVGVRSAQVLDPHLQLTRVDRPSSALGRL